MVHYDNGAIFEYELEDAKEKLHPVVHESPALRSAIGEWPASPSLSPADAVD